MTTKQKYGIILIIVPIFIFIWFATTFWWAVSSIAFFSSIILGIVLVNEDL